jgi:hypothetical protein
MFAASAAILVAVGGFVFLHAFEAGLRSGVLSGVEARAAAIAQSGPTTPGAGRPALPAPASESLFDQDELAQVIDPSGNVLAASGPQARTPALSSREVAAVLRAGHPRTLERHVPGFDAPMLLVAAPGNGLGSVAVAGKTLDTVDSAVRRVELVLLIGGPMVVLMAAAAAWLIAGAALRPVERMRKEAAEISAHDRDATLGVPRTRDEVAALADTLNDLLRRVHALLHRQRSFVADALSARRVRNAHHPGF